MIATVVIFVPRDGPFDHVTVLSSQLSDPVVDHTLKLPPPTESTSAYSLRIARVTLAPLGTEERSNLKIPTLGELDEPYASTFPQLPVVLGEPCCRVESAVATRVIIGAEGGRGGEGGGGKGGGEGGGDCVSASNVSSKIPGQAAPDAWMLSKRRYRVESGVLRGTLTSAFGLAVMARVSTVLNAEPSLLV